MRQAHDSPWEANWLLSFFSSSTQRDGIGLVPNGLPTPPSRNSVACKITRYTSHWLHTIRGAQALRSTLVSHVRRSLLLTGREMEPRRRGLPVATKSWQQSPPPPEASLAIAFLLFPESRPWGSWGWVTWAHGTIHLGPGERVGLLLSLHPW